MAKSLKVLKPFTPDPKAKKAKYCSVCGNIATQEAHFDVGDGAVLIERYCDQCSGQITK